MLGQGREVEGTGSWGIKLWLVKDSHSVSFNWYVAV